MQIANISKDRMFLACGALVAPVFYFIAICQLAMRPEFDMRRLPLSYLSIGRVGWIQNLNFLTTGALALLCAVGMRRALRRERDRRSACILIGLFGLGMMAAGVFNPDPLVASGSLPSTSGHGALHTAAFMTAFASLIGACFVMARCFAREQRTAWRSFSVGTGLAVPFLIVLSSATPRWAGLIIALAGLMLFSWLSAIAWNLLKLSRGLAPRACPLAVARF